MLIACGSLVCWFPNSVSLCVILFTIQLPSPLLSVRPMSLLFFSRAFPFNCVSYVHYHDLNHVTRCFPALPDYEKSYSSMQKSSGFPRRSPLSKTPLYFPSFSLSVFPEFFFFSVFHYSGKFILIEPQTLTIMFLVLFPLFLIKFIIKAYILMSILSSFLGSYPLLLSDTSLLSQFFPPPC